MATVANPDFPDFPQADFEAAIRGVMDMAAPNDPLQKATFRWKENREFVHADRAGRPLTLTSAPVSVESHPDVQVRCIISFQSSIGNNELFTPVAEFDRPRVVIQMFDDEYQLIKGSNEVLLGLNTYSIKYIEPPQGLFESGFWIIHAQAEDES